MFSGIVEEAAKIVEIKETSQAIRLIVESSICKEGLKKGDSVAVNGCCLTVVEISEIGDNVHVGFDLLHETWRLTNFQFAKVGSLVNLERSLRLNTFMGGHFVTGHIDGIGWISRWEKVGKDWVLEVKLPPSLHKYTVYKGSIAIDGISLTIADLLPHGVRIWIIPHTYEKTNLRERKVGDPVNVETDIIAKYVERLLSLMDIKPK